MLTSPSLPPIGILAAADNTHVKAPARSQTLIKMGLILLLLNDTVFSRMGHTVGSYFMPFSLVATYLMISILFVTGIASANRRSLTIFIGCVILSSISWMLNKNVASTSSLILLFAIYMPYVITVSPHIESKALWLWTMRTFTNFAFFIALVGIMQFFAQTVIYDTWLFDYKNLLPVEFRETGVNTVIPFGSFIKSNGFFLAEPSSLSGLAAIGIIFELTLFKRYWRIAAYVLALLVSYSGSGILTLIIFSLLPLGSRTILRAALLAACAGAVLFLFGDTLHLWQTVDRVSELKSQGSSGYARFVGPVRMLYDLFASEEWSPLFGHGPGMMLRTILNYDFHDPTYAKLLFEYGALGALAFIVLVAIGCRRSPAPARIKVVFFVSWLIGGGALLSTTGTSMMWAFLAMWPFAAEVVDQSPRIPLIRVPKTPS